MSLTDEEALEIGYVKLTAMIDFAAASPDETLSRIPASPIRQNISWWRLKRSKDPMWLPGILLKPLEAFVAPRDSCLTWLLHLTWRVPLLFS